MSFDTTYVTHISLCGAGMCVHVYIYGEQIFVRRHSCIVVVVLLVLEMVSSDNSSSCFSSSASIKSGCIASGIDSSSLVLGEGIDPTVVIQQNVVAKYIEANKDKIIYRINK